MKRVFALLTLVFLIVGCGGLSGTYVATAESGGTATRTDAGYSVSEMNAKLQAAPRSMIFEGGKFTTKEGDRTVWTGTWKKEGDKVLLRATTVNGVTVTQALQDDKPYTLRKDGAIVDDTTYRVYGVHLVYRKR